MAAITAREIAAYVAHAGRRLAFLRRNFLFLAVWPVAGLIIAALGWNMLFAELEDDLLERENAILREASALSRSYADQLSRTVESVDQILLHVRYEWTISKGDLRLEEFKKAGLFTPSSAFGVAVVDRNGALVTSSAPADAPVNVSDRGYFLAQKEDSGDRIYIGMPTISLLTNRYVIPFSRKLIDRDGFAGVAVVQVVPDYLTAHYDQAILGDHGFMAMVGGDRILRAARAGDEVYPPPPPPLTSLPYFASPSGTALLDGNESFSDRRSRYVGWASIGRYSFVAIAGLDQQSMLAPYYADRTEQIRFAIWATVALTLFTLTLMLFSMRLAWRKYKMESAQATYRMATEEGNEGFYIARPIRSGNGQIHDFAIIDSNHRGAEMLRQRREDLIGRRISALYEGANPDRLMRWLSQAMETGFYENDVEAPGDTILKMRWVHIKIIRSDDDLAITLRDISESKAHVAELERRGNEDALTGLPNRHWAQNYLPRAIERARENGSKLALLFVDLDGFKKVNDTMGHAAGDELLRNAARRLKEAVRPRDQVVRLGGDEFLVIIEQIESRQDAAHVAERVVNAFKEGFRLEKGVHSVGTSIGISTFPSDGNDADALLHNADIAMYSVKTSGKGNYRFYDSEFYDALRARLEREAELREAIELDQFIMHYQPRVDMTTGMASSMEALVRWIHPARGLVEPVEFIPLAEETGLILGLGELIIDKVCAQLAQWRQAGQKIVPVSINVSSRQFNETDIARIVSASLARHQLDAALVEIEVTESSMMGKSAEVLNALTTMRRMGVKLLVDDFGTGYSSLSQLQRLDFDMLKVDRAFTAEIDRTERGNVFFKAIITMAHAVGMRVVAEGVEKETQLRILRSLQCDEVQGFYVSRPMPPSEAQHALSKGPFPVVA